VVEYILNIYFVKIIDINQHLSARYFLYDIITNEGNYYLKINFKENEIDIFKLYNTNNEESINPISFLKELKNCTIISKELSTQDLVNMFIGLINEIYLDEYREDSINQLLN
jgi:hypothetical protein